MNYSKNILKNPWKSPAASNWRQIQNPNQLLSFWLLFARLQLVARESKTEQRLSSTSTVIVTVEDENDNPPFFDSESYTLSVPENATEDTEIGSVSARDRDSGIYGAQGFRYQLSATNDLFTIDNKTGALSVLPRQSLLIIFQ